MSDSAQFQRYFFVHMQRTAGIALRRRLKNHFGEDAVYPTRNVDGAEPGKFNLSIDHLRERLAARGDQIEVITGHFPLCTVELLDGHFTTLTLLREPVERTLSYLRHHRQEERADRDRSLEEIYDDPFRFHGLAHNHMTKMLSLTPAEMTEGMLTRVEFNRDRLERAKEALAGIDAVGLQEHFEDFCDELAARFGWRLGEAEFVNTSARSRSRRPSAPGSPRTTNSTSSCTSSRRSCLRRVMLNPPQRATPARLHSHHPLTVTGRETDAPFLEIGRVDR